MTADFRMLVFSPITWLLRKSTMD